MATLVTLETRREALHAHGSRRIDAARLERALAASVRGEVRFDAGSRGAYATDASNYRQVPIGVVIPRDTEDVIETVRICREHGAPVLGRGGGTSLAGQCCNVAVVMDFTKYMNRVLEIDPERRRARVQPGCVLDDLRDAAAPYGLTFGPDPATHDRCTLGGMIGNNSCGIHSVQAANYGPGARTEDSVEELVVLTYDGELLRVGRTTEAELDLLCRQGGRRGEIYRGLRALRDEYEDAIRQRFPDIPRRVSGYNLPALLPENGFDLARALVGSECTCALTLEATVALIERPERRTLLVLGYDDVYQAADHVPAVMAHGPIGLEGIDHNLVRYMQRKGMRVDDVALLPDGRGWLLVEFGAATQERADATARRLMRELASEAGAPRMKLFDRDHEAEKVWAVRESGLGATAFVPGMRSTWPGWEDAAVPPDRVGDYLREFRDLLDRYGYECALYGHFGQGCIHTRIDFDLQTHDGIAHYLAFIEEAADLVVRYGGSLSGEHGDGQSRASLLPKMYGPEVMRAFVEFKRIWDPENGLNPGKLVDPDRPQPYRPHDNLFLGVDYAPPDVETHFRYPDDGHAFANATLRCVGVGKCRRQHGGTMCPSYMVTREEKHSTRGRARLLYEMLEGDVVTDGWRSEEVKEALDLCLACKGCKGECPVHVDMATYKAEFLSHYWAGRPRPRHAYAMGLVYWWARVASRVPAIANFVAAAPALGDVVKKLAGIDGRRRMPAFAHETFRAWWRRRGGTRNRAGTRVMLWPDTFNTFFHPEKAKAAVEVLEAAGFSVRIPDAMLCCGRPLYDYGMLDLAKHLLREIVAELRPEIRAGTPLVGLEPSCVSTFRDELPNLLPHDHDAQRLQRQSFLFSEFMDRFGGRFEYPRLTRTALVHGHCHHRSVLDWDSETRVLERMGIDYEVLDSGCCGMAGSFGFEEGHYEIAQACGERVLLPRIREANRETMLITDGYSCNEQIVQSTGRSTLHLAEVIRLGLVQDGRLRTPARDELPDTRGLTRGDRFALAAGAGALLALLATTAIRKERT